MESQLAFENYDTLEDRILLGINNTINEFQRNPYAYLRESDIQAYLFVELRKNIPIKIRVPKKSCEGDYYNLELIYTEYMAYHNYDDENNSKHAKIDLVCLNHRKIETRHITQHKNLDTYIYKLPILTGIELKALGFGDHNTGPNIINDDYNKLSQLQELKNKLALCFIQSEGLAKQFMENIPGYESLEEVDKLSSKDGKFLITPTKVFNYH